MARALRNTRPTPATSKPSQKAAETPTSVADTFVGKRTRRNLNLRIDSELHADFKATAAQNGVNMVDVLTELISDWVETHRR